LGLIVGVVVTALYWLLFTKDYPRVRTYAKGTLITLAVIVLGFFAIKNTDFAKTHPVLSRFTSISFQETTVKSRFMVWNMAWEGFKERPILGWGQENFNYVFNKHYNPDMFNQEPWFDRTHSVVFDWLVAGGALGLLSYLSILVVLVGSVWKSAYFSSAEKAVLFGLISAYVFQNLFVFDNLLSYVLFASLLGYVHGSKSFLLQGRVVEEVPQFFQYKVVAVLCVGLVFLYAVNARPLFANRSLIQGFIEIQTGVQAVNASYLEQGFASFEKALAYNSFGTIEIREQLAQVALSLSSVEKIPQEIKQKFILFGKKALEYQIKETPEDIRHYALLGSFLNSYSQFDEALVVLQKAHELSPKKQFVLFEMATSYLNKGEYDKAFEAFKKGYDLSPQFSDIRLMYALGALYADKDSIATEILPTVSRSDYVFDNRFIALYELRKDYKTIISLLEERVSLGTTNSRDFLSLAAVYLEVGRRADAITQIEKAVSLDPSLKAQGDFYITEIRAGRNP
jgi:tetratricopeptide (TPR) repeat protein